MRAVVLILSSLSLVHGFWFRYTAIHTRGLRSLHFKCCDVSRCGTKSMNTDDFSLTDDQRVKLFLKDLEDPTPGDLMKMCKVNSLTPLDAGVVGINFEEVKFGRSYANKTLFARSFYNDLLAEIRSDVDTVLIGNPLTSKSTFHHYYLARIFYPALFKLTEATALPPDYRGSTCVPKVVARQIGDVTLELYKVHDRATMSVGLSHKSVSQILAKLSPLTSVYLFEPSLTQTLEPAVVPVDLPRLATVSPNERRFKYFSRDGAQSLYMPTYTLPELLAIGKYIRQLGHVPEHMHAYYTDEGITASFAEFGGIISHVFPYNSWDRAALRKKRDNIIDNLDCATLTSSSTLDKATDLSTLIACYEVTPNVFSDYELGFVSADVTRRVVERIDKLRSDK